MSGSVGAVTSRWKLYVEASVKSSVKSPEVIPQSHVSHIFFILRSPPPLSSSCVIVMALESLEHSNTLPSSQELPTIVLVQGSFQTPLVYEKLVQNLVALGHPTFQPPLPSCSNTDRPDFPAITLVDDALAIRSELMRQVEYGGKRVVVAMHAYGGLVGSEAIAEELTYTKRHALGLPGGVIYLFYFCAFMLSEGQSVLSAFGESPNNDVKVCYLNLLTSQRGKEKEELALTLTASIPA